VDLSPTAPIDGFPAGSGIDVGEPTVTPTGPIIRFPSGKPRKIEYIT
jgi:hypothetical protein